MSASRDYDDSVTEATLSNAWHRDKRRRIDKSLERLCKREQGHTNEERDEETEVLQEPVEDLASETKPAFGPFLEGVDRELLERVAAAHEGGSQSDSPEESDLESQEVTDNDDAAVLILPFLNVGSKSEGLCGDDTGVRGITTPLCTFCHHIFDNWVKVINSKDPQGPVVFPHCRNPSAMEELATNGCSLCTQFLQVGLRNSSNARRERREAVEKFERMSGDPMKFPSRIVEVRPG